MNLQVNFSSAMAATLNPNPTVYASVEDLDAYRRNLRRDDINEDVDDPFDALEVFDILSTFSPCISPTSPHFP